MTGSARAAAGKTASVSWQPGAPRRRPRPSTACRGPNGSEGQGRERQRCRSAAELPNPTKAPPTPSGSSKLLTSRSRIMLAPQGPALTHRRSRWLTQRYISVKGSAYIGCDRLPLGRIGPPVRPQWRLSVLEQGKRPMDFEKFSDRLKGFVQSAQTLAIREGNPQITPEHLLKVLLDDPEGLACRADHQGRRQAQGGARAHRGGARQAAEGLRRRARRCIWRRRLGRVLDQAEQIATKAGDSFVTVERVLQALAMAKEAESSRILADAGVTPTDAQRRHQRAAQGPHRGFGRRRAGL